MIKIFTRYEGTIFLFFLFLPFFYWEGVIKIIGVWCPEDSEYFLEFSMEGRKWTWATQEVSEFSFLHIGCYLSGIKPRRLVTGWILYRLRYLVCDVFNGLVLQGLHGGEMNIGGIDSTLFFKRGRRMKEHRYEGRIFWGVVDAPAISGSFQIVSIWSLLGHRLCTYTLW